VLGRANTTGRGYNPSTTRRSWLLQALGRFGDYIGVMDSMVFEVVELDGATMIVWEHLEGGGWIGDPVKLKLNATKIG
jgi:hypothetical protein